MIFVWIGLCLIMIAVMFFQILLYVFWLSIVSKGDEENDH